MKKLDKKEVIVRIVGMVVFVAFSSFMLYDIHKYKTELKALDASYEVSRAESKAEWEALVKKYNKAVRQQTQL